MSVDYFNFADELDFRQVLKNPILDIAARLWDGERYEAFKTCYRSMRAIDDLVDGVKSQGGTLSEAEKGHLASKINGWLHAIEDDQHNDVPQMFRQSSDTIPQNLL